MLGKKMYLEDGLPPGASSQGPLLYAICCSQVLRDWLARTEPWLGNARNK